MQYKHNLYMHWETKTFCVWLYCNIRFIAMVWNRTRSVSEVCLYLGSLLAPKC